MSLASVPPSDSPLSPRQCGRCRKLFEGDPALNPNALPEWWLCPPCRTTLLGAKPAPSPKEYVEPS
jgi:hypothetical protein